MRTPHRQVPKEEVAIYYDLRILGNGPFIEYMEPCGLPGKEKELQPVWRFPERPLTTWIADRMTASHDYHWMERREPNNPCPNLNDMAVAYARGQFSLFEYMQFYRDMGYSLSGFMEIFQHRAVEAGLIEAEEEEDDEY